MPDEEVKESQVNEESVEEIESPTEEDLVAAFDEFMADRNGETETPITVTEETEEEETPLEEKTAEEVISHEEQSKLGRKVASLKRQMDNVATKNDLQAILQRLDEISKSKVSGNPFEEHEEIEAEEVNLNDPRELDRFLTKREEQRNKERELKEREGILRYTQSYLGTMASLLDEVDDASVRTKIKVEMLKEGGEYNKKYSENASADCAKNFTRALKFAQSKPTVFDKNNRAPDVPKGVNGPASAKDKNGDVLKHELDEYSAALVKKTGMSVKDINEALDSEVPDGLKKRG
jgi:hypothetical protein